MKAFKRIELALGGNSQNQPLLDQLVIQYRYMAPGVMETAHLDYIRERLRILLEVIL